MLATAVAATLLLLSTPAYANVVHPTGGPPWLIRMVVTFLFPK